MTYLQMVVVFFFLFVCPHQSVGQTRYLDKIFAEIVSKTYTYSDTLKVDYYHSKADKASNKAVMVVIHGGGFANGSRDAGIEKAYSVKMAEYGYAVFSISYRLTRKGKSFGCDCSVEDKLKTYRASVEDLSKALKFINGKSGELKLDMSKIVLSGSSAGASIALNYTFLQNHHLFRTIDFPQIKTSAVISMAGGILDADYIDSNNAVPSLLIHGEKDMTLPFKNGAHRNCSRISEGYLRIDGPLVISQKLKELKKPFLVATNPEGNHDWAQYAYEFPQMIKDYLFKVLHKNNFAQTMERIYLPKTP